MPERKRRELLVGNLGSKDIMVKKIPDSMEEVGFHKWGRDQVGGANLKRNGGVYVRRQVNTPRRGSAGIFRSPRRQFWQSDRRLARDFLSTSTRDQDP